METNTVPEEAKNKIANWHKEKVYQYTLSGDFVAEWESAKSACDSLGLHRGRMCNILNGNNIYKGFKWHKNEIHLLRQAI